MNDETQEDRIPQPLKTMERSSLHIVSILLGGSALYLKENHGRCLIFGNIQQIIDGEVLVSISFSQSKDGQQPVVEITRTCIDKFGDLTVHFKFTPTKVTREGHVCCKLTQKQDSKIVAEKKSSPFVVYSHRNLVPSNSVCQ